MKVLDFPAPLLTPSRQPLATVNGTGSGLRGQQLRSLSLKPSLPRIEALRCEGGAGKLDGRCTPRGGKTPKRNKRQKSKSCASTPSSLPSVTCKPKPDDSVVDSITSHLFDRLVQAELGLIGSNTTVHQPKMLRRKCGSSQLTDPSAVDTAVDVHDARNIVETSFDDAVSTFVEGIISNAVQTLQQEAQIPSIRNDAKTTSDIHIQTLKSPTRSEPSDEDVESYVDAVLSVQLQIVRMEYEEKLNSCLDVSLQCPQSLDASKDSLQDCSSSRSFNDDKNKGYVDENIDDSLVGSLSFDDETPSRVSTQGTSPCTRLLLDTFASLSAGGSLLGVSPGYMLLPPRREVANRRAGDGLSHASRDSQGSYEDEFLKFVHSQYDSRDTTARTDSPVMQDTAVCTTPSMNDVQSNAFSHQVKDTQTCMTPLRLIETSTGVTPVKVANTDTSMTPVKVANTDTSMTPVKISDISTETNAVSLQESGTGTEVVQLQDAMIGSPLKVASVGVSMTPIKPSNAQTNTSPTKVTDSSTDMGIEMTDCGSDARQPEVRDAMVGTPVKQRATGVGTSPVSVQDTSSWMTPVKMQSIAMGTSPAAKVQDSGTEMPTVHLMDTGVGMSPLPSRTERAVGTSPKATSDREVGSTPISMTHMNCGTTPHQYIDSNTAMTPVFVCSTQTLTSPPVVPSLRFSTSPNSVDPAKLVSHVQTAAISNQLLRTEIQMLRSQKAEADERLTVARRQVQENEEQGVMNEDKMRQMKRMGRASADKEIDDLMCQVGEQMMQIGQMEAALGEVRLP
eukprot:XP_011677496.1 PREDICTED: uncharacterized protein LOC100888546 [Strongylocentrotus purpuratus]